MSRHIEHLKQFCKIVKKRQIELHRALKGGTNLKWEVDRVLKSKIGGALSVHKGGGAC